MTSFGPDPRQQSNWDARAAGNFIGGGFGSGLVVFAAIAGAQGDALLHLMVAGVVLVGAGLFSVWLEIGRPFRSMNVLFQARRSWMTREAMVAPVFVVAALGAAVGVAWLVVPAALLALVFVYCQASILRAAKGIPTWREPLLTPFMVATALAEGAGVFWLYAWPYGAGTRALLAVFGALVILRIVAWFAYRRRIERTGAQRARVVLDRAGAVLRLPGTLLPLALVAVAASGVLGSAATLPLAALAGASAAAAGAFVKWTLITRAGYTQGFVLPHLPVRGVRSRPA